MNVADSEEYYKRVKALYEGEKLLLAEHNGTLDFVVDVDWYEEKLFLKARSGGRWFRPLKVWVAEEVDGVMPSDGCHPIGERVADRLPYEVFTKVTELMVREKLPRKISDLGRAQVVEYYLKANLNFADAKTMVALAEALYL